MFSQCSSNERVHGGLDCGTTVQTEPDVSADADVIVVCRGTSCILMMASQAEGDAALVDRHPGGARPRADCSTPAVIENRHTLGALAWMALQQDWPRHPHARCLLETLE